MDSSSGALKKKMEEHLSLLTAEERRVIELRFGLYDGILREPHVVAVELNRPLDDVRRTEEAAMSKLRTRKGER